jgi:hypothetical protein
MCHRIVPLLTDEESRLMDNSLIIIDKFLESRRDDLSRLDDFLEAGEPAAEPEEWNTKGGLSDGHGIAAGQTSGYDDFPDDDIEDNPEAYRYRLQGQIDVLEQVKDMLAKQHAENQANFLDIKQRDDQSSRQSLWLTITTSVISIIIGWLLSLLSTPVGVLHALGR